MRNFSEVGFNHHLRIESSPERLSFFLKKNNPRITKLVRDVLLWLYICSLIVFVLLILFELLQHSFKISNQPNQPTNQPAIRSNEEKLSH